MWLKELSEFLEKPLFRLEPYIELLILDRGRHKQNYCVGLFVKSEIGSDWFRIWGRCFGSPNDAKRFVRRASKAVKEKLGDFVVVLEEWGGPIVAAPLSTLLEGLPEGKSEAEHNA
jgi:hypothetical protein